MLKLLNVLIILLIIIGCSTSPQETSISGDQNCRKKVPNIDGLKGPLWYAMHWAMTEKAHAGYSLDYSEKKIFQMLKDDFQNLFIYNPVNKTINKYLDDGYSCSEALRVASKLKEDLKEVFQNSSFSIMQGAQLDFENYRLPNVYAKRVIDESLRDIIVRMDKRYQEDLEKTNQWRTGAPLNRDKTTNTNPTNSFCE